MKILIDTNVLIDFISMREPYFDDAKSIFKACINDKVQGCIAAVSVTDIFYILRKLVPENKRREELKRICKLFTIIGIDKDKLIAALDNATFTDFEDCLQSECAVDYGADYIVTRNTKDFENCKVKPITPKEFLQLLSPMK